MELYSKWFITWYSDWTFRPNNPITRTEILKLIFLVAWVPLSTDDKNYFIDIPSSDWQKKYVNTWVNLKLISTKNKKFNPNWYLTRVEALKMITKLFIWDVDLVYSKKLADVSWNDWYSKYVEYAINNDLLSVVNNHFYPNKNITRYEVIVLLYKLSKMQKS